ncbi:MAG: FAD-dependent oxidoreductase [Edaphobacter sp.]
MTNALDLIAGYKSGTITAAPERVVVIGAGNTAIDAAIAAVRLGAADVNIVYRRGAEQMSAFAFEYAHARDEGVKFLWHVQPVRIRGDKSVAGIELVKLEATEGGSIVSKAGSEFVLGADLVVLSIGQGTHTAFLAGTGAPGTKVQLERGPSGRRPPDGSDFEPKVFCWRRLHQWRP